LKKAFIQEADAWLAGQVVLVDKPEGPSAFGVVKKVRGILRRKYGLPKIKVGHAGTLDPLATGLMVLCTGKATKTINTLMAADKVYSGKIKLGAETPSWDRETDEMGPLVSLAHLDFQEIQSAAHSFVGAINQVPPLFSAIKKDGTRLYDLARKGSDYVPDARPVVIHQFEIVDFEAPFITFRAHVSKGTYIRSLAFDLGKALGVGGYLFELRRERSGDFDLKNAFAWEEMEAVL
jgi:tRNA pseudouridine55 synthase